MAEHAVTVNGRIYEFELCRNVITGKLTVHALGFPAFDVKDLEEARSTLGAFYECVDDASTRRVGREHAPTSYRFH